MKKERWDEENLEQLLKQAPKVTDHRTKDEIFNRLKDDGAFNEQPPQIQQPNQKGIRWAPLLVSIASLFIIVLIGAQFLGNDQSISMEQNTFDMATTESEESAKMSRTEDVSDPSTISNFSLDAQAEQTLIYESQLEGVTLFKIGLAGDDAESVPVSILIPNEVVVDKLGTDNPTTLELYKTFSPLLDEQMMGFNEYHPLKGELREEGDRLIHTLPDDHGYDTSSATLSNYFGSLVDTFGNSYEEVQIEDAKGEVVYFDYVGETAQSFQLKGEQTQYNYFMYQMRDGAVYSSPNFRMTFPNVTEAIDNMTTEANDIYRTVILPGISLKVEDEGDIVTVTFEQALDLEQYDAAQAMRMIEGLILTAASFDKQIKFEKIVQENWSGFDFTKPLEKPIAGNLLFYNF
ncbi:hypothetical protein [Solibacillus merdavium]|uniref:Sigma-X negative effector n=1 Tax=Solibacillus merdavium TaxID=2762218 RepID=A0ABR8XJ36_9BACL|nr:hypothetical protein [Solibacillus merdavium]MBD8031954.1 hypothetical protein [Solibacillus merdavium]